MNSEYIIFSSALSAIAQKTYKAGIGHEEGGAFIVKSFKLYNESGLPVPEINWLDKVPVDSQKWMKKYLEGKFLYMKEAPKWVGESSWRFIDDVPMIFISQTEFCDNITMADNLSVGDIIYIFAGKRYINDGWEMVIKLIKQDNHSTGTTYIY